MEKAFKTLADKIITTEELNFILQEINQIHNLVFKETNKLLSKKLDEIKNQKLKTALEKWEKDKIISNIPSQQAQFLEDLKKYLQQIPQIRMQVARPLPSGFLKKLALWFQKETGKKIILEVIFDPKVVGGVALEYQGKYYNLSLAKEIDKIIEEKRIKGLAL